MKKLMIKTDSAQATKEVAKSFASLLVSKKGGKIIFLKGDLGSGKTTFVSGFLSGFGIKPLATSPTFVIMKMYKAKNNGPMGAAKIYHLDAYRLKSKKDWDLLGFEKIKKDPGAVVLIEWPERIKGLKLKNKINIHFIYGQNENERTISFIKD